MKKLTPEKKCPVCGSDQFTLCQDFTQYSVVTLNDGVLVAQYDHDEEDDSYLDPLGSRRLMCSECGEYLAVPEELA